MSGATISRSKLALDDRRDGRIYILVIPVAALGNIVRVPRMISKFIFHSNANISAQYRLNDAAEYAVDTRAQNLDTKVSDFLLLPYEMYHVSYQLTAKTTYQLTLT